MLRLGVADGGLWAAGGRRFLDASGWEGLVDHLAIGRLVPFLHPYFTPTYVRTSPLRTSLRLHCTSHLLYPYFTLTSLILQAYVCTYFTPTYFTSASPVLHTYLPTTLFLRSAPVLRPYFTLTSTLLHSLLLHSYFTLTSAVLHPYFTLTSPRLRPDFTRTHSCFTSLGMRQPPLGNRSPRSGKQILSLGLYN